MVNHSGTLHRLCCDSAIYTGFLTNTRPSTEALRCGGAWRLQQRSTADVAAHQTDAGELVPWWRQASTLLQNDAGVGSLV